MARPFAFLTRQWNPLSVRHVFAAAGAGALCTAWHQRRVLLCNGPEAASQSSASHASHACPTHAANSRSGELGDDHLLLAVPKKGRLYETVNSLLKGSGIEYKRRDRLDIAHSTNMPVTLVFLPASDIATYVASGNVDLGITGEDIVAESEAYVNIILKLGFGKCNLSVQAPEAGGLDARGLAGKRIVTSFPNVTRKFFGAYETPGQPTQIKFVSGSVEAACGLGLADGIVDLVETGTTMRAAGLAEVAVVMKSQSVLIANPHTRHADLIEVIRKRIAGYLTAKSWLMVSYNVERTNLSTVVQITPGKRSPSMQPLEDPNWVAVSALVPKKEAACVMDRLEAAGATDILLMDLESSRMGD